MYSGAILYLPFSLSKRLADYKTVDFILGSDLQYNNKKSGQRQSIFNFIVLTIKKFLFQNFGLE